MQESDKNLERFMFLLGGMEDGVWDWNLATGEFWLSDRSSTMLGYDVGELKPSFNTMIDLIHPDDLGNMLDIMTDYMVGNIPSYCLQYRLRKKDNSYLWTESRGISAKREGEDEPYRLCGYHSDVTVRKEQEMIIAEKTADINNMLHNMMQGVFTIVPGNKIHHEYSSYLEVILGTTNIANSDAIRLLFEDANVGVDIVDQVEVALTAIIGEDEISYEFNSHLLLGEISKGKEGNKVILQVEWVPIIKNGIVEKILVILQNVTEIRKLALEAQQQQEELNIIGQILRISKGKFNAFISSSYELIEENRKTITQCSNGNAGAVSLLFRNMHTLKGNARNLEFDYLTDIAHEIEQYYQELRENVNLAWDQDKLMSDLSLLVKEIEKYEQVNEGKLGRKGRSSDFQTNRGVFVTNEMLDDLINLTDKLMDQSDSLLVQGVHDGLMKIHFVPLERLASGLLDSVCQLAKELGKPEPEFVLCDKGMGISHCIAEPVKSALMHIVSNCMSHGIESAQERFLAGKVSREKSPWPWLIAGSLLNFILKTTEKECLCI